MSSSVVLSMTYAAGARVKFASAFVAAFTVPEYFFFVMAVFYIVYGLTQTVLLGFLERLPLRDPLADGDDDEGEVRELDYGDIRRRPRIRRRRRSLPPEDPS